MRQSIIPSKIIVKNSIGKLTISDIFTLIASLPVGFLTSLAVYDSIRIIYVAFVLGITFYCVLPNNEVYGKKNYEAILLVLRKDKQVYHAIERKE